MQLCQQTSCLRQRTPLQAQMSEQVRRVKWLVSTIIVSTNTEKIGYIHQMVVRRAGHPCIRSSGLEVAAWAPSYLSCHVCLAHKGRCPCEYVLVCEVVSEILDLVVRSRMPKRRRGHPQTDVLAVLMPMNGYQEHQPFFCSGAT